MTPADRDAAVALAERIRDGLQQYGTRSLREEMELLAAPSSPSPSGRRARRAGTGSTSQTLTSGCVTYTARRVGT